MSRNRYTWKKCRERGSAAIALSVIAVACLVGSWISIYYQISEKRHAHISYYIVFINVALLLVALWQICDWVRYKRRLRQSMSKHPGLRGKGGRRKKRNG